MQSGFNRITNLLFLLKLASREIMTEWLSLSPRPLEFKP
jgi:hypothetical protein